MTIRKAIESDLEEILDLYHYLFKEEDYSDSISFKDKWDEILKLNGLVYFVATENGKIVSTCNIMVIPNLSRGQRSYALIENVITHPDYRRKGYGRLVIEKAINQAKKKNCYKVMLLSTSSPDRFAAHKFYEQLGFDGNSKRGFSLRFS